MLWSGSPSAPSKPSVKQQDRSLLLQWVDGATGDSPIYGYLIQNKKKEQGRTSWTVCTCGSISQSVLTVGKYSGHECITILGYDFMTRLLVRKLSQLLIKRNNPLFLFDCSKTILLWVFVFVFVKHKFCLSRPVELCCSGVALHTQSNNRNIGKLYYSE